MAIYNAYCDRVPVYIVIGNNLDATKRDSGLRGMAAQRAGRRGDGPRLHEVGRRAHLVAALRGIRGARLQDRDDAADGAGAAGGGQRAAGKSDSRGRRAAHSEADAGGAAAGRFRLGRRGGSHAGCRRRIR